MNYRTDKYGNRISALGFGCMRFTQKAVVIDLKKAEKEIMEAYSLGVNYFDTAYIYPGSENALGTILERNGIREEVYIADKLPHYLIHSEQAIDKYFLEHLKRLKTDYIDYYLMHMLTDISAWEKLKQLGIEEWIRERKAAGEIRQVGFSYHGSTEMFIQLLDAYDWDFCQIQYNYLDEHTQAGRKGLQYAASKGIPVIIMEPLRGGKLAVNLPTDAMKAINAYKEKRTPAEWSFRWLWDQPEVTCVLSGMNSMEMLHENVRIASSAEADSMTQEEFSVIEEIKKALHATMKVGCTGCRYCMPCPKGVDIPGVFAAYNRTASDGRSRGRFDYMMSTALRQKSAGVSSCVGCGKCEQHCPQHIEIRKKLKEAGKELEGPAYKMLRAGVKVLKPFGGK